MRVKYTHDKNYIWDIMGPSSAMLCVERYRNVL